MKINGKKVVGNCYAYDNCHKIYICENLYNVQAALECGYIVKPLKLLIDDFNNSCELKFISNWSLTEQYVQQFEEAIFED